MKREHEHLVSVVIPCLNERGVIRRCLDSILANGYPQNLLEVIVVDGMSVDGTRETLQELTQKYNFLTFLDNPRRTQQIALNLGIARARGDYIIRMDAHCSFAKDYISQCVSTLIMTGADAVGGRLETLPRHPSFIGKAIAEAMAEAFGTGGSLFRVRQNKLHEKSQWVDSVPYPCYRSDVFSRVGLYNELLDRSEDIEFHYRMKRAGLRILFVPELKNTYYARSDLLSFWKHALDNGKWAILPIAYADGILLAIRHVVPFFSVLALILLIILSFRSVGFLALLLLLLFTYVLLSFFFSLRVALRLRNLRLLFVMPFIFGLLHIGYGLGSFVGLAKAFWIRCGERVGWRKKEA